MLLWLQVPHAARHSSREQLDGSHRYVGQTASSAAWWVCLLSLPPITRELPIYAPSTRLDGRARIVRLPGQSPDCRARSTSHVQRGLEDDSKSRPFSTKTARIWFAKPWPAIAQNGLPLAAYLPTTYIVACYNQPEGKIPAAGNWTAQFDIATLPNGFQQATPLPEAQNNGRRLGRWAISPPPGSLASTGGNPLGLESRVLYST